MRIVHLITRMILGGAQENTMLCCQGLREQFGDDVLLLTGPTSGPEGSLMPDVAERRIGFRVLPALRRDIHPWHDWRALNEIQRVIRDFRPDVVHTHSAKAGLIGRIAAARLRVPVVVHTVHGAPFHEYQGRGARAIFRGCERFAAKRCHGMISVANAMTDRLVAAHVAPREKFITIYSGMEIEPFLASSTLRQSLRESLGFRPDHVVIGKVARLFHLKGHEFLIEAARGIVGLYPQVRFVLIGDGVLRLALQAQIRRAGLEDYFTFVGLVAREQMPAYLAATDMVVHTSLREGLARALPQALLSGKPVVSFDIDGAREVVETGVTGVLVPPCDVGLLKHALLELVANPSLRETYGNAGRLRCRDLFCHRRMTATIRELYVRLASR